MSPRKSKGRGAGGSKNEPAKEHAKLAKPPGHVPAPLVMSRHHETMIERPAKGFSAAELEAVALPGNLASDWGIRVDHRRRSSVEANVRALRKWFAPPAPKTAVGAGEAEKKPRRRPTKKKEA